MRRIALFVALLLAGGTLASRPTFAAEDTDVLVPVHQFLDGFNKGDAKSALAACASPAYIVDEFAPYAWQGPTACADWANDYDANAKKNAITDGVVTLGRPRHVDVVGDHAYVVVPTDYAYKQAGKPVKESGSTMTLALQKGADGWRITAWTWAKH